MDVATVFLDSEDLERILSITRGVYAKITESSLLKERQTTRPANHIPDIFVSRLGALALT